MLKTRSKVKKFLAVLLCLTPMYTYAGGVIMVTTTADGGGGSLRDAIELATISGDSVLFNLVLPATINITGDITWSHSLNIVAPSGSVPQIIVKGGFAGRIFYATGGTQYIEGIEIAEGQLTGFSAYGAGVRIDAGTMILNKCVIRNCTNINSIGGGVMAGNGGNMTIDECIIKDNTAQTGGGGMQINAGSQVTISNSTINGNTTNTGNGGGIRASGGILTLTNSTVTGNAAQNGGGVSVVDMNGDGTFINSTIASNSASSAGDEIYASGMTNPDETVINFLNTIVYNTTTGNAYAQGSDVIPSSSGYNICSDGTMASFLSNTGDQNNTNPQVGTLGMQGGTTPTMDITFTSPAREGGTASGAPLLDQRGYPRYGTTDIGAFEWQCTAPSLTVSSTAELCQGSGDGTVSASLSSPAPAPYTYTWSNGVGSGPNHSGVAAGVYSVTATDANGCDSIATVTVSAATGMSQTSTYSDMSCNGTCDGTATITTVLGGTSPYTYVWDDPMAQTSAGAVGLCAGTVSCTILDANGCTISLSKTISEPNALSLTMSGTGTTCSGNCDGNASVAVSGGTFPYTYAWDDPGNGTGNTVGGLCTGSFSVTVIDNNGCGGSGSYTVVNPNITVTVSYTEPDCNSGCNGTATGTVTGAASPLTYLWDDSGAQTTVTATNLCAAGYALTIIDGNGCSSTGTVTVTEPAAMNATTTETDPSCNNGCDGSSSATVAGGTSPLTYSWGTNPVQTNFTATGLCAGNTYTLGVYDANGCSALITIGMNNPAAIATSTSTTSSTCGGADGTATVTATGGTGTLNYLWDDGAAQTTATAGGLTAGPYMVIVADSNNCADTAFATVSDIGGPSGTMSSTSASCGGLDGTATITIVGGTSPFTYLWDDPSSQIISTAFGLAAGTYIVSVEDGSGCTYVNSVVVNGSAPPAAQIDSSTDVSCFAGNDGAASASATGGTAPYTYLWNDPSSQTNSTATSLVAGTYTAIITDANGCLDSVPITIVDPTLLTVTAVGADPSCNGANDGTVTATAGGGTMPYVYAWNDPSSQTTVTATGLDGGSYTVILTDSNGCTNSAIVSLNTPAPAMILTATIIDEASCQQDGIILLSVSGGVTPYTYLWSSGETVANLNGLSAGFYGVTVTDSAGCFNVDTFGVSGDFPPSTSMSWFDETSCGAQDGIALLTVTNGAPPYTYNWSNGASSQNLSGLSGGVYTVVVSDSAGCSTNDTVSIAQPEPPSVAITGFDETSCGASDGIAAAAVTGGTGPYTYNWSNGGTAQSVTGLTPGTYILTVTGADGCTGSDAIIIGGASGPSIDGMTVIDESSCGASDGAVVLTVSGGQTPYTFNWSSGAASQNLTGITSGVYVVTVTDANSCTAIDSVELLSLGSIVLSVSTTDANCGTNSGSAVVTVTGGTAPYSYGWSSGDTTANADSLTSGIYIATVQDLSGCSNSIAASISDVGGATITISSVTDVSCNGGTDGGIDISVSGGITPYTYSWSNGASSEDVTGVPAGPYEIDVTDANGCSASQSITVSSPSAISLTTSATDANCGSSDGSAMVSTSGGSGSYTFTWSNGGTDSIETSLAAGVYSVSVSDGNGCTTIASAAVSNIGGPTIVTDLVEDADCVNPVGSIYISVSGGSTPYTYEWSNLSTDEDLVGVPAGTYSVNVTDSSGCVATASIDIAGVPPAFESICMVTVDTVTGTNLIVWEKNQTQGVASYNIYKESTQIDIYFLIGNVSVNSLSEYVDTVSDPAIRSWRYKISVVDSCGNESDLSADHKTIHMTINLGINNWINLIWDHYEGFTYGSYYIERFTSSTGWQTIDSIPANLTSYTDQNTPLSGQLYYQVSAKHPDGCTATKAKNYNSSKSNTTAYDAGTVSPLGITSTTSDASAGLCDGSATANVTGGVSPYTYLWSDSLAQTSATAIGLCPGNYDVTVYDSNGDSISTSIVIGTLPGMAELNLNEHISVYPNPNRGTFTVDLRQVNGLKRLAVFNVLGEQVLMTSDNLDGMKVFDLTSEPVGIYYVQVITETGIALKKVIIE